MKRYTAIVTAGILLVALSACDRESAVTNDQAREAFVISYVSVFVASMGLAFGEALPGVSVDEETQVLTLKDFSLAEFFEDDTGMAYTSVSGTVTNQAESMVADMTMKGGPVTSIAFALTPDQMESEAGFTLDATVNGVPMRLEMTDADFQ